MTQPLVHTFHLTLLGLCGLLACSLAFGCGPTDGDSGPSYEGEGCAGSGADSDAQYWFGGAARADTASAPVAEQGVGRAPGAAEQGGSAGSTSTSGAEGGAAQDGDAAEQGGSAGSASAAVQEVHVAPGVDAPEPVTCTPQSGPDLPDDDFVDSNCDGIDGDVRRAVFVAPAGADDATGSIDDPVPTISRGIELAVEGGLDVYVCVGWYPENVVIHAAAVNIYGGYDCEADWARTAERPTVAPPSGVALRIVGVDGIKLDRIDFVAADGMESSDSSVAAVIDASSAVTLAHVTLEAGSGFAGVNGAPAAAVTEPPPAGEDGEDVTVDRCPTGVPAEGQCARVAQGGENVDASGVHLMQGCFSSGRNYGGQGGDGGNYGVTGRLLGEQGHQGMPNGASGGTWPNPGQVGPDGIDGAAGMRALSGIGTVVDGNYLASNAGTDGEHGGDGQPGGGGSGGSSVRPDSGDFFAAYYYRGSGGGQGGYGGCGGAGGRAGGAGGGSIALLLIESDVTLRWCAIRTAAGGDGGVPSAGASGQPGGVPGRGGAVAGTGLPAEVQAVLSGEDGGYGGRGGRGGAGGPGGGGPSIGILVQGQPPSIEDTTFDIGDPGAGGAALAGPDAPPGETGDVVLF
jgi:hypothetical protein